MLRNLNEKTWKRALERDPELKDLAVKAGVENNLKRVQEFNGCFAWNGGRDVVKSKEESELARYMFCMDDEDADSLHEALQGRMLAARSAGISLDDL